MVIGAGGLGHIGIQCLKAMTPTEIIVVGPNEKALALAAELGADHTIKVEGSSHIDTLPELTDGMGAEAIIDFVGEKGAVGDGVAMIQDGGFYYVIGYGQNLGRQGRMARSSTSTTTPAGSCRRASTSWLTRSR